MNPKYFGKTDVWILSVLVHEMAHVWQQEHGKPGRGRYHNKEWAAKMLALGTASLRHLQAGREDDRSARRALRRRGRTVRPGRHAIAQDRVHVELAIRPSDCREAARRR